MKLYQYTNEDLEATLDVVKTAIMQDLAHDGIMTVDEADRWCNCHTILIRKHPAFERLKDKLKKSGDGSQYFIVVKAGRLEAEAVAEDSTKGKAHD